MATPTSTAEIAFIESIDGCFPYLDERTARALVYEGAAISDNAALAVAYELAAPRETIPAEPRLVLLDLLVAERPSELIMAARPIVQSLILGESPSTEAADRLLLLCRSEPVSFNALALLDDCGPRYAIPAGELRVLSRMEMDLRQVSFDEWLNFIFDHDPVPEDAVGEARKEWYWLLDSETIAVDAGRQILFLRRLFEDPSVLLARFTPAQVDQGFWCMFGGWGDRLFREQLWNPNVPWDERAATIRAIGDLYEKLFGTEEVGSSGFMLWDMLAYDYYCGRRKDSEDVRVQQVMFETLERMLHADSEKTQRAALHGLHHVMHRDAMAAVRSFLAERSPSEEVVAYAEQVLARRAQ